jgi:serine protease
MLLLAGGLSIAFAQNTGVNPGDRATDAAAAAETDDRFYVEFRQFGPASAAAVEALGGRVVHRFPELNAVAARLPQQAYRMLLNNPNVVAVEADPRRYRYAVSDTVVGGETTPYGIKMVQADQVASGNHGSRKVCIIDSGYYMAHEDLQNGECDGVAGRRNGRSIHRQRRAWDACGGNGGGAGRQRDGVRGVIGSGNLKLHIVKVFGDDGAWAYSSDLVAALGQCRTAGANVVSMSLGGSFSSRYEQNAFANAYSAGVLSVAAAGNAGSSRKSYPASYSSVISVAAVDSNETVAPFSQYNDAVELAAPGVAVLSTVPYEDTSKITVGAVAITGNHVEFSARTSSAGVTGTLVEGGLCTANPGTWSGKIVHCQRGDISFYDKVRNVQLGGGTAVVISNNVEGDLYATLGSGNSSTIPAIGVTQAAGTSLAGLAGQSGTVVSLVQKPYSGYSKYDGTSMATPHVSGVAALVWSHGTSWTNVQIREALQASAKDLGAAGRDNYYGYGLVQAKAALDRLNGGGGGGGGTDTTPPVISGVQARVTNAKNGSFEITWTTDEPATSTVTFAGGALGSKTSTALVTSHRIAFKGTKGASYTFTVSSTDAAGNTATSGPFPHEN